MSRLDEIRERLAAATPGPWVVHNTFGSLLSVWAYLPEDEGDPTAEMVDLLEEVATRDAEFIAACPEDIAYLLGEIERLSPLPANPGEEASR